MDGRPDPRTDGPRDEAATFSMKLGSDQPGQEPHLMPGSSAIAPPALTPAPMTPSQPISTPPAQSAPTPYPPQSPPSHYPEYPQYPRYPDYPLAPQYPPQAPYPLSAPPASGASGYAQPPMQPPAYPPPPTIVPRARGPLGRPFPLPLSLLVVLGCAGLLALAFVLRVFVLRGDWADGAVVVGVTAMVLAVAALLGAVFRALAGRRSLGFALASLALLIALVITGIASLAGSPQLHQVQAQSLERSGKWSVAIQEYALTGEKGPNAPDIARVQDSWAEQLLQQHQYQGALDHFQTVLDDYQQSGDAVARAQKGQILTYAAWLKNDPTHVPYREAIDAFANYTPGANCASDCQAALADAIPQAYYLYATQLLSQKRYVQAISEFGKLTANYGSSSYAKQAHAQVATAYFAYGQQQIAKQDCSGAVSSYTTLVKDYKDTPEAAKAQAALSAPQDVTGFVVNAPTNPSPTMHLSKQMNFYAFYFSDEYSTALDPKTGAFTFKQVALGTYYVSMSRPIAGGTDYVAWWADSAHSAFYSFTVTPLCPTQLGTFH